MGKQVEKSKAMKTKELYQCPCCGLYTLEEDYEDSYEICPMCGWEREYAYELDPDNPLAGCANGDISLNQARKYWQDHHNEVPHVPYGKTLSDILSVRFGSQCVDRSQ